MEMKKYLPMTKKQLAEVVECYTTAFPDWKIINGQVFARKEGPILQLVGIEKLRYCAYRPWSDISTLTSPAFKKLHQFLDIKHQVVRLGEHSRMWRSVLTAMEEQFTPSILEPLDLHQIKNLCEQKALEKTNDLCMLAILNAYLGEKEEAIDYCKQAQNLPPFMTPPPDWELENQKFASRLLKAIEDCREQQFLDDAAIASLKKLNLGL